MDEEAVGTPLRVGDFARLAGLTPKALRHYDRIGLLRPLGVDSTTAIAFTSGASCPPLV